MHLGLLLGEENRGGGKVDGREHVKVALLLLLCLPGFLLSLCNDAIEVHDVCQARAVDALGFSCTVALAGVAIYTFGDNGFAAANTEVHCTDVARKFRADKILKTCHNSN